MFVARCVVLACLASCAVRAPVPIDVDRLLAARGPVEARRDLAIRVTSDPRDVAAHLALATLAERLGRPSEAIDSLEAVVALGGPAGTRWDDDDRLRLARLIAARGRARLARGAASALADLTRARTLGADISDDDLRRARLARALSALRHSDADTRTAARAAFLADAPEWSAPQQRGRFGAWLWQQHARRAAWDELSAWHAVTPPPRDPTLQDAYLVAARWWLPLDRPPPPIADLVGPSRCAFSPCSPTDVVGDDAAERAYLLATLPPPTRDPAAAAALAILTLHQTLRGETAWGAALSARIDLAAFSSPAQLATLPPYAQPLFARLAGRDSPSSAEGATPDQRLLIAAARMDLPDELFRLTNHAPFTGDAFAEAAARHAALVVSTSSEPLRAIVVAYRRDPAIADRLRRDAVAGAADAAAMHATLGALFDALADPARARAEWQAAVDASAEPGFLLGLAEAQARQGDPDAALITATSAAAASGDPAVVWARIAYLLTTAGKHVHALEAARSAIDLAGPEALPAALDAAISASRALGRTSQAAVLADRRARLAPTRSLLDRDPTDADAAVSDASLARLWVASRWNPRNVAIRAALLATMPADDARRALIVGELVDLAADRDPAVRLAAIAALHP